MSESNALRGVPAMGEQALDPAEESRLLAALATGDRRAAEDLARTTYRAVYSALFRLTGGDADLAADLTQETYRKAWKALPGFAGRSKLGTWLYRIAYNAFLNHIRRPVRLEPLDDGGAVALRDPRPGQEETLRRGEESERLRRAVVALPEELRFTVSARFWGDLPVKEIARLEQVTGAAIRKRLKNAMRRLRLAMVEEMA